MRYGFINNFATTLSAELASGATTMELADGGADLSAASEALVYTLTLFNQASGNLEIVHVTSATGDTLTIERAKEGTTAQLWPSGTTVEMRLTAGALSSLINTVDGDAASFVAGAGAVGDGSFVVAVGSSSKAYGNGSAAIGEGSTVGSDGGDPNSDGFCSSAIGWKAIARGSWSSSLGWKSEVHGASSVAIGYQAKTGIEDGNASEDGYRGIAIGRDTHAAGKYGTAIGSGAATTGTPANAIGYEALGQGDWSEAFGYRTKAYANVSLAIGYGATVGTDGGDPSVDGYRGVAIGRDAAANTAPYTLAIGYTATSTGQRSVALGPETVASQEASVIIGRGANVDESADENTVGGVAIGAEASIGGSASFAADVAIGRDAKARGAGGRGAIAVGMGTTAEGRSAVAVGWNAKAAAEGAYAFGAAWVEGEYSVGAGDVWGINADYVTAVGSWLVVGDYGTTPDYGKFSSAYGFGVISRGTMATALGTYSLTEGAYSVALGPAAHSTIDGGLRQTALPYLASDFKTAGAILENEGIYIDSIEDDVYAPQPAAARQNTSQIVLSLDTLDLTTANDVQELALPTGTMLFIDSVDVVVTGSDSPGGSPEIQLGTDAGTPAGLLAASAVTKTALGGRDTFSPLTGNGVANLRAEVTTAGTGTTFNAKVIVRGYVMEL